MSRHGLIIAALIAITLIAFCEVGACEFVNYDDPGYVKDNPHVTTGLSGQNFCWAWTTFQEGNYLPLTWLSFQLDATLFGKGPHGFHWVNLAFHAANASLVYLFLMGATGSQWRSALAAGVFAVHPLRVESVAWVVERKDVLSGFLGLLTLLTLLAYLAYSRRLSFSWYGATLLLFAATLLAKQTLATLPFLLLLLDYWPLGRWNHGPAPAGQNTMPKSATWPLILEKVPLLAMSVGILLITIRAQASDRAVVEANSGIFFLRLGNAAVSYCRYLWKMVWLGNLAPFYPQQHWSGTAVLGAVLLLAAITAACVWKLRSSPWLTIGWLWFLGVLLPMIGIVQFGGQAMADRFTYISGLGLLVALIWSIPEGVLKQPVLMISGVMTTLGLLMVFTFAQTGYWHNSVTLFRHAAKVADSQTAEMNLGAGLWEQGRHGEALIHFRQAVEIDKRKAATQARLALALLAEHQFDEALRHADAAVNADHLNAAWRLARAKVYFVLDRLPDAEKETREALRRDQASPDAEHLLKQILDKSKQIKENESKQVTNSTTRP